MIGQISILLWTIVVVATGVGGWVITTEITLLETPIATSQPDRWLWYAEPVYLGEE